MKAITQETLHHILPGKMAAMAAMYVEDHHTTPLDALRHLYRTSLYRQLEREETKLWHCGPVALYEQCTNGGGQGMLPKRSGA